MFQALKRLVVTIVLFGVAFFVTLGFGFGVGWGAGLLVGSLIGLLALAVGAIDGFKALDLSKTLGTGILTVLALIASVPVGVLVGVMVGTSAGWIAFALVGIGGLALAVFNLRRLAKGGWADDLDSLGDAAAPVVSGLTDAADLFGKSTFGGNGFFADDDTVEFGDPFAEGADSKADTGDRNLGPYPGSTDFNRSTGSL